MLERVHIVPKTNYTILNSKNKCHVLHFKNFFGISVGVPHHGGTLTGEWGNIGVIFETHKTKKKHCFCLKSTYINNPSHPSSLSSDEIKDKHIKKKLFDKINLTVADKNHTVNISSTKESL